MPNCEQLIIDIQETIRENGNNEITGPVLQDVLLDIVYALCNEHPAFDALTMWQLLGADTEEQINVSHLSATDVAGMLTQAGYKLTDTTYALATDAVAGLLKTGYAASGRNYAVKLDEDGKAYVNVPWTDKFDTYFGVDADGNVYVKDNRGFYGNSFISARGSDPEAGGGASGVDMDTVWEALAAGTPELINVSHIPELSISKITGLQSALDSKLEGITRGMVEAVLTGTITSHNHDGRYAPLSGGLIPSQYLPSYVDDVLEYASMTAFPATGEAGKIYVALDTNLTYRWGGSGYVEISPSLALGHTSSTAYPGDEGAANASAIQTLQGYFSGGAAKRVEHALTISYSGGDSETYDGSSAVTVTVPTAAQISLWDKIAELFDVDADGHVYVTGNRGFYGNSFLSARGSDPEAGAGGSGVDMDAVWDALAAGTTEKINVSHLSATDLASLLTGAGYKLTDTTYTLASFGITATAAEINKLDGLATTATELGYVHGVTSNIQTQLNAKANASALASYALKDGSNASGTWPISVSGNAATATDADLLDGTQKSGLLTSVASTAAANLSVTVGGTTKSVADLYATYLDGYPATAFDLSTHLGTCQDYGCYVIGLMQITDYTTLGNHANGELILIRQNGNNPTAKIVYSLSTKYNTTEVQFGHLVLGYYSNYVVPCTFTYNGKKWAGFNVTMASAYTNGVVCKRDGLRLCERSTPFLLKYKVSNTGEVLNSEVNGSLVVNGSDITNDGVSTNKFVGPLKGNAASATKLATARSLWGQSFDGTGNVSGDMTGVGSITMTGGLTTPQYVQVGSGRLKWDAANNALYVEKSDGTACGLYSKGYMSARGSDPEAGTSGGGLDEAALWDILTSPGTEKIDASHLPAITASMIEGLASASVAYAATSGTAGKVAHALTVKHDGGSSSAADKAFDGGAAVTVTIPTTLPASDVYAWAKAATKPSYTWGEIGGKPSVFTPAAHTHPLSDLSDLNASWDALLKAAPSAYVTRWPAWGEVTGKPSTFTPSAHKHVKADITDFPSTWAWSAITGTPSTLAGYGITDGVNSVTASGGLSASVSGHRLTVGVASGYAVPTSAQIGAWNLVASLFGVDADGNVYVKDGKGFYGLSFVSSRGSDPEAGSSGSGLDEDAMWDALAASGSEVIDPSHIPALNISKITGLQSELDGKLNNGNTTYDTAYAREFRINGTTYTLWAITNPGTIGPLFAPSSPGTNGYILQSTGDVPAWISRSALTQQLFSGYKGCELIPDNSDLNDYTTPGLYFCPANATVQTLANVPVTGAFSLEILQAAGVIQILREYGYSSNANEYTRRYCNGSWTTWVRAPRLNELYTKTEADGRYLKLIGGTLTGSLTTQDVYLPEGRNILHGSGTGTGMVGFRNGRTVLGSISASTTAATHIRSITGHVTTGSSDAATYNVLDTGNYTSYTVTKTGGGASGTWGINISGNAKSATNATYANRANYLYSEYTGSGGLQPPSYFKGKGLKVNMMSKPVTYSDVVVVNGYNGVGADVPYINAIGFQKTSGDHGEVYHARGDYGGDSWGTWHKFLDEYNYAGILDSRYVKKSGDTMTGALSLSRGDSGVGLLVDDSFRNLSWTVDTSGGWARSLKATDPTGSTTLINAVGVFGAGQTPKYVYLGGTDADSPSMAITAVGTVGIGTTSPNYRLDVRGTGYFSGVLTASAGLTTPQYVQVGGARLKWDASANALYVEKSDGTACGFYSKGFVSARGSDPEADSSELVPVVTISKLTVGNSVSISVLDNAGLTADVREKMCDGTIGRVKAVFSDGSTEIWPVLHASNDFISFGYDTVLGGYQDIMNIYEITIPSKTTVIRVEHFER